MNRDSGNGDVDMKVEIAPNAINTPASVSYNGRPSELSGKSTPKLDALEMQESGVSKRYVHEFLTVYKGCRYQVPGDIVAYVEHRAARKLGMKGEGESIKKYEEETGVSGLSKPTLNVYDTIRLTGEYRTRIPDIFKEDVVIGDVKDVKTLSYDAQMRDNIAIHEGKASYDGQTTPISKPPKKFDLVVRDSKDKTAESTHVSQPLRDAVENTGGEVYELI